MDTTHTPVPNEKSVIKQKILSVIHAMNEIDTQNEYIKDILKSLKDEHSISPKDARKVAKLIHEGRVQEFLRQADEFTQLLDKMS